MASAVLWFAFSVILSPAYMIDPPFSGFIIYYFVTFYGNLFKSSLIIDLETNVIMFIKCETQSATYWCNNWEKNRGANNIELSCITIGSEPQKFTLN